MPEFKVLDSLSGVHLDASGFRFAWMESCHGSQSLSGCRPIAYPLIMPALFPDKMVRFSGGPAGQTAMSFCCMTVDIGFPATGTPNL